jgi:hypothetical protein
MRRAPNSPSSFAVATPAAPAPAITIFTSAGHRKVAYATTVSDTDDVDRADLATLLADGRGDLTYLARSHGRRDADGETVAGVRVHLRAGYGKCLVHGLDNAP